LYNRPVYNQCFKNDGLRTGTGSSIVSLIMIFIGALLTGLDIYDDIGRYAGAGSIVPITGFANSIVSPAIEFKSEGYVMGVEQECLLLPVRYWCMGFQHP